VRPFGNAFPAESTYLVDAAEQARLARVDERFGVLDRPGGTTVFKRSVVFDGIIAAANAPDPVSGARTDYVTPGARWVEEVSYAGPGKPGSLSQSRIIKQPVTYEAGSRSSDGWLGQPLRPDWYDEPLPKLLGTSDCEPDPVWRAAGNLHVALVQLTDRHGRFDCGELGNITGVGRRLALYRDGQLLGEAAGRTADFSVPREPHNYQLVYEQDLGTLLPVSTRVATVCLGVSRS